MSALTRSGRLLWAATDRIYARRSWKVVFATIYSFASTSFRSLQRPLLADHFLTEFAREYGHRIKRQDEAALAMLQSHTWPGNVRELRNVLERLTIVVPSGTIGARHLGFLDGAAATGDDEGSDLTLPLHDARHRFERDFVIQALAR